MLGSLHTPIDPGRCPYFGANMPNIGCFWPKIREKACFWAILGDFRVNSLVFMKTFLNARENFYFNLK